MNTPARFDPVPPLFLAERTVVHTSTRSQVAVNMSVEPGVPAAMRAVSRRMEMTVDEDGALLIRFHVQDARQTPARPVARGMVSRSRSS